MKNNQNKTFFWALIFIAGGGIFLMRNFGMLDFNIPVKLISWRLIPLIIGINALLRRDYINGIIAITVAVVFYIPDFLTAAERTQYYKLWPLLLVGVGLTILAKYMFPRQFDTFTNRELTEDRNYVSESNIMAGSSSKFVTKDFTGGKVNCIMGGSELNLTEADLRNNANLRVFIMMGGMEMRIPKEWNVKLDVLPIMGGVEDKITKFPENVVDKNKVLIISGYVIMGGIEIKRV
ncbi:MAG: hypothetical protein KF870_08980 [Leadbetterella sp.]|nr:hypothetical protein [Leadbetterella sp.]